MLGISAIGTREIARLKDDKEKLNKCFSSLFVINTITTTVAAIVLIVAIEVVPDLSAHKEMMYIGLAKLCFNYLAIEWLYRGLEEFKYITIRSLITKVLYVIAVFVFVHEESDYIIYFTLTTSIVVLNSLINRFHAIKFVKLVPKGLNIFKHIRPCLILGFYNILTSMYTSFNVAYLGFAAGEKEVGYYTTATKLYGIFIGLFSAFTGVMIPRMSDLLAKNEIEKFKGIINKSIDTLFCVSVPIVVFTTAMAPSIIRIISGSGYDGAITPMRIVMPLMIVIGYEQIVILQGLLPLQKDKALLINSILGSVVGLILNLILVPLYASIGSSVVWISSELAVLISAQYFFTRYIGFKFPFKTLLKYLITYVPLFLILLWFEEANKMNEFIAIAISGLILLVYFSFVVFKFIRNEFMISTIQRYIKKLR
jgi:O-antigen/teichoic acid export membrane protein